MVDTWCVLWEFQKTRGNICLFLLSLTDTAVAPPPSRLPLPRRRQEVSLHMFHSLSQAITYIQGSLHVEVERVRSPTWREDTERKLSTIV